MQTKNHILSSTVAVPCFKHYLALALVLGTCGNALAQATHMMMPEGSKDIDLGVAALVASKSEGNSQQRLYVVPFASIRWSNGVFLAPGELGMVLPSDGSVHYGPLLTYGIKPERADNVDGTHWRLEAGGFFNYKLAPNMGFKSSLLYGGGDQHQGARANLSIWMSSRLTREQSLTLELGAALADAAYMQSYFGVSTAQAARGPYARYDIGGGIQNTFISAAWHMSLTPKYDVGVRVGSSYLYEAAAASPLTSSRRTSNVMTSVTYHY